MSNGEVHGKRGEEYRVRKRRAEKKKIIQEKEKMYEKRRAKENVRMRI